MMRSDYEWWAGVLAAMLEAKTLSDDGYAYILSRLEHHPSDNFDLQRFKDRVESRRPMYREPVKA